ncbi:hypothetical protein H9P43_003853 [Blastocladiella emersonii ATCC 22665]|nr:hypothetical protein H9P43_003853 [Blastocladiella emersonii ATCC 22665]
MSARQPVPRKRRSGTPSAEPAAAAPAAAPAAPVPMLGAFDAVFSLLREQRRAIGSDLDLASPKKKSQEHHHQQQQQPVNGLSAPPPIPATPVPRTPTRPASAAATKQKPSPAPRPTVPPTRPTPSHIQEPATAPAPTHSPKPRGNSGKPPAKTATVGVAPTAVASPPPPPRPASAAAPTPSKKNKKQAKGSQPRPSTATPPPPLHAPSPRSARASAGSTSPPQSATAEPIWAHELEARAEQERFHRALQRVTPPCLSPPEPAAPDDGMPRATSLDDLHRMLSGGSSPATSSTSPTAGPARDNGTKSAASSSTAASHKKRQRKLSARTHAAALPPRHPRAHHQAELAAAQLDVRHAATSRRKSVTTEVNRTVTAILTGPSSAPDAPAPVLPTSPSTRRKNSAVSDIRGILVPLARKGEPTSRSCPDLIDLSAGSPRRGSTASSSTTSSRTAARTGSKKIPALSLLDGPSVLLGDVGVPTMPALLSASPPPLHGYSHPDSDSVEDDDAGPLLASASEPTTVHVFIDHSNILHGAQMTATRSLCRGIPNSRIGLDYARLVDVVDAVIAELTRPAVAARRSVVIAKRVLVASRPLIQPLHIPELVPDYDVHILDRVAAKPNTTAAGATSPKTPPSHRHLRNGGGAGGYASNDDEASPHARHRRQQHRKGGDGALAVPVGAPTPRQRRTSGSSLSAPSPVNPNGGGGASKEQFVDELLQYHMSESLLDHAHGVMVVLTGDGKPAEHTAGFVVQVARALRRGWTVGVVAFSATLSSAYPRMAEQLAEQRAAAARAKTPCGVGELRIWTLDGDVADLVTVLPSPG